MVRQKGISKAPFGGPWGPKCAKRVPKAIPKSIQKRLFCRPVGGRARLHETSLFTMYNPHRGVPGMVDFSTFCRPGASQKRQRQKRRQNAGPRGRKWRPVSKMVSKLDPKGDPKSIKNRAFGPVPAPRVPKCRFWGPGVDFRVFGGTPRDPKSTKNRQNGVAHGRPRDQRKTLGTWPLQPRRNERSSLNAPRQGSALPERRVKSVLEPCFNAWRKTS